jgi:hypothetical protein
MTGWFVPPIVIPISDRRGPDGVRLASSVSLKICELRDGRPVLYGSCFRRLRCQNAMFS